MLSSLIIRVDGIYLGQQTTIWQGDMFLISPQSKPWTWVSTRFILVCIELLVANLQQLSSIVLGSLFGHYHLV
jgi:hypothetical protein